MDDIYHVQWTINIFETKHQWKRLKIHIFSIIFSTWHAIQKPHKSIKMYVLLFSLTVFLNGIKSMVSVWQQNKIIKQKMVISKRNFPSSYNFFFHENTHFFHKKHNCFFWTSSKNIIGMYSHFKWKVVP